MALMGQLKAKNEDEDADSDTQMMMMMMMLGWGTWDGVLGWGLEIGWGWDGLQMDSRWVANGVDAAGCSLTMTLTLSP